MVFSCLFPLLHMFLEPSKICMFAQAQALVPSCPVHIERLSKANKLSAVRCLSRGAAQVSIVRTSIIEEIAFAILFEGYGNLPPGGFQLEEEWLTLLTKDFGYECLPH